MIKTGGYNTGTIDGILYTFVVRDGKKIFLQRIHRASKIFRCLPRNKEVVGIYYFRSVWKRQAANYPAKWSVKTNRDVHGSILSRTCPKPFDQAPIKWPRLTLRQSLELWKSGSLCAVSRIVLISGLNWVALRVD